MVTRDSESCTDDRSFKTPPGCDNRNRERPGELKQSEERKQGHLHPHRDALKKIRQAVYGVHILL